MNYEITEIPMNVFTPAPEAPAGINPEIKILPEWDKLVAPVEGVADFDHTQPIPPIEVNLQDGQLVLIDGRKRLLACKGRRIISFRTHNFSRLRARDEFLKRHTPIA